MFSEDMIYKLAGSMLGISHEQARAHFKTLQDWNVNAIKGFDSRLRKLESDTAENAAILRAIASHLGIQHGTDYTASIGTNGDASRTIDGEFSVVGDGHRAN